VPLKGGHDFRCHDLIAAVQHFVCKPPTRDILRAMKTKTLELAMDKAATLPAATQEQIGREVLERIDRIARLRSELEIGARQLDAGLGEPLDIEEIIATARTQHGRR